MTQPTLAQPLGGWFKPADRLGHLVAFLHVHEIVNEMDELASKGKPVPVYRDIYVVDLVDLNEGGANAVVQRRIKVGHAGIAGRLDTENKSVVLGVVAQGEAKDRNTSAPWILAGHTPQQGDWFLTSWWPGYAAQKAREGGPTVAQPAQRVSAPAPDPQQWQQQQWQQPAPQWQQPQFPQPQYAQQQFPQNGGNPYQGAPQPYPQQAPQVPAPQSAPPASPAGAGAVPPGYAPAPTVPQTPPVAAPPQGPPPASAPPQAVPHAWPAGAVGTPPQAPPPPVDQTPAGYPAGPPAAPPAGAIPAGPPALPPGLDPAAVDPGTAALMAQMWPGSVPGA